MRITPADSTPALRAFGAAANAAGSSLEKLSTGLRLNRGADGPAELIAAIGLERSLAALDAESRALTRSDAVARVADGSLSAVSSLLAEADATAVAFADSTRSDAERDALRLQFDSLVESADRELGRASFAGRRLFDGTVSLTAGGDSLDLPSLRAGTVGATELGGETLDLADTASGGAASLDAGRPEDTRAVLGAAIGEIATLRGELGAFQLNANAPRLDSVGTRFVNESRASSTLRDTDFAAETARLSRGLALGGGSLLSLVLENGERRRVLDLLPPT